MDPFGAMAHGYTLPAYRGRGYLTQVMRKHVKQIHAAGYPVYGNVALDNIRMLNVQEQWGLKRCGLCYIIRHDPIPTPENT